MRRICGELMNEKGAFSQMFLPASTTNLAGNGVFLPDILTL